MAADRSWSQRCAWSLKYDDDSDSEVLGLSLMDHVSVVRSTDVSSSSLQQHIPSHRAVLHSNSATSNGTRHEGSIRMCNSSVHKDMSSAAETKRNNVALPDRPTSDPTNSQHLNRWRQAGKALRSYLTQASLADNDSYLDDIDELSNGSIAATVAYSGCSSVCSKCWNGEKKSQHDVTQLATEPSESCMFSRLFTCPIEQSPLNNSSCASYTTMGDSDLPPPPPRPWSFNVTQKLHITDDAFSTVDTQNSILPLFTDLRQNIRELSDVKDQRYKVENWQRQQKTETCEKSKQFYLSDSTSSSSSLDELQYDSLSNIYNVSSQHRHDTDIMRHGLYAEYEFQDSSVTSSKLQNTSVVKSKYLDSICDESKMWDFPMADVNYQQSALGIGSCLIEPAAAESSQVDDDQLLRDFLCSLNLNDVNTETSMSHTADTESSSSADESVTDGDDGDDDDCMVSTDQWQQSAVTDSNRPTVCNQVSTYQLAGHGSDCWCTGDLPADCYGQVTADETVAAVAANWHTLCNDHSTASSSSDTSLSSWEGRSIGHIEPSGADDEFECDCPVCLLHHDHITDDWSRSDPLLPSLPTSSDMLPLPSIPVPSASLQSANNGFLTLTLTEPEYNSVFSNIGILDSLFQDVIVSMLQYYPDLLSNQITPPVTANEFAQLDSIQIVKSQLSDESSCSICLCPFEDGEGAKCLPCQHFFHTLCIHTWLCKAGTCPVCRDIVVK
jgi:hypothetical protein